MPLFDFTLTPLDKVAPWTSSDGQLLNWFALTDGAYSMQVGEERLFQYREDFLKYLSEKFPHDLNVTDCVGYQVSRFHEDLLEILPAILSPVPDKVHDTVSTVGRFQSWLSTYDHIGKKADADEDWEDFFQYRSWSCQRFLTTNHIAQGPVIFVWQNQQEVHIRWDNSTCLMDGLQAWTTVQGHCRLSVKEFMQEVESFHQRLMDQMQQRVHIIQTRNPFPTHIYIDVEQLIQEQEERTKSLAHALATKPAAVNWESVMDVNAKYLA